MISKCQLEQYRIQLSELSRETLPEGMSQSEAERRLIVQWREFVPDKPVGRQLYESYTDEALVEILQDAYRRLGRSPVQSDIFCFYRTYIKHRFVTWTGALRAADLGYALDHQGRPFSTDEWGRIYRKEAEIYRLLICLSERRTELGYPPRRKDFTGNEILKRRFGNWATALNAAEALDRWLLEIGPMKDSEPEASSEQAAEMLLQELRKTAAKLGRTPVKKEIREEHRVQLRIRYGSWNSVIRVAGLIPLEGVWLEKAEQDFLQREAAGRDALYRIAKLEHEYVILLQEVEALSKKLGRAPLKEEVDARKRSRLQKRCGSWRNTLYQIGITALSKEETAKIKQEKRKIQKYDLQK